MYQIRYTTKMAKKSNISSDQLLKYFKDKLKPLRERSALILTDEEI